MRRNGLWHEPDFLKLWGGQAVSHMGSTITDVGLPLTAVMMLGASPFQMGLLSGAGAAVVLVFGLFAGAWADRLRRRPILIVADLARAAVLGTVPLAAAFHRLSMGHLYLVVAVTSLFTVLFEVSYQAYVPSLVDRENLVECNSKLALAASAADAAGPGLTGVLVEWITAPRAILFDAVSFLISAVSIALIRKPEPQPKRSSQPHMGREIVEGLRASWREPILRVLAQRRATGSFFLGFGSALYMIFAVRELGLGAALLGTIISVGGVSSLAGAFAAPRLVRRFGFGPTFIGAAVVTGITMLAPTLARGPVVVCAAILGAAQLFDMAWPIYFINELSLRQAVTPDHLLGRVNSAMHLLFRGILPVGSLAGGMIAQAIGIRQTMFLGAVGYLLSTLWLVFSPVRKLRELPKASPIVATL
jgi:MFS family permease